MKSRTGSLVAIAASAALGLTACGDETPAADPKVTTPARSVTTSAPNTATSTTPTTASSTKATEEAAAIALVQKYVDEYNKALQSGSTTAFRATFEETCAVCLADANTIDEAFRKNQRIQCLQYAAASPFVSLHDSRQIFVQAQMSQAGGQLLTASGNAIQSFTPTAPFRFNWRVKPGSPPVIFGSDTL